MLNNKRHLVVNFMLFLITKLFRGLISFHPVTFVAFQSTDEKMSSTSTSEKVPLIDLRAPPQVKTDHRRQTREKLGNIVPFDNRKEQNPDKGFAYKPGFMNMKKT